MAKEIKEAEKEGRPPNPEAMDPNWIQSKQVGTMKATRREWRHEPFVLPRHMLDRTQPGDLGYTTVDAATARWQEDHPGQKLKHTLWSPPFPDCPVSHSKNLELYVLGFSILADQVGGESRRDAVLIPEIGHTGCWRCRHVYSDGLRCLRYASIDKGILCEAHLNYWKGVGMKTGGYEIQDPSFSALVEKHRTDPNIRSVDNEVAIMRSMLSLLLRKINDQTASDDPAIMSAVLTTSKMVTEACEKMVAIEAKLTAKMSIEQLSVVATAMFEIVCEVCEPTPEQAHTLAAKWAKICDPKRTVMVDAETGEMLTADIEMKNVMAEPPPEIPVKMTAGNTAFSPTAGRLPEPVQRPPPQPPCPPGVRARLMDLATDAARWGVPT